jgi:hypothetical protein
MRVPFTLSDNSITVFVNGKMRTVLSGTKNFDLLYAHLMEPDHNTDLILILSDREQAVRDATENSKVEVRDGVVYYEGAEVYGALTNKLLNMLDRGFDAKPWMSFLENLMSNPSYRSRQCLFEFLDHFNAPITPEGKFIAFKRVGANWKDLHTGSIDNSIGAVVTMDRSQVDDDPKQTCSSGLHVCADEYLKGYATGPDNRTLVVEVDPADVVAVPYDYKFSKMRVCKYKVLAQIGVDDIPDILDQDVYEPAQGRCPKTGRFLKKA